MRITKLKNNINKNGSFVLSIICAALVLGSLVQAISNIEYTSNTDNTAIKFHNGNVTVGLHSSQGRSVNDVWKLRVKNDSDNIYNITVERDFKIKYTVGRTTGYVHVAKIDNVGHKCDLLVTVINIDTREEETKRVMHYRGKLKGEGYEYEKEGE